MIDKNIIHTIIKESVSEILAHHGSPHDFDAFDTSKMSSGEGCQAHGWGIYVAIDPKVGKGYARNLGSMKKELRYKGKVVPSSLEDGRDHPVMAAYNLLMDKKNIRGARAQADKFKDQNIRDKNENMVFYWDQVLYVLNTSRKSDFKLCPTCFFYEVDIDEGLYLEEMLPVGKQLNLMRIKNALYKKCMPDFADDTDTLRSILSELDYEMTGSDLYYTIASLLGNSKSASLFLNSLGIKGIHYYGQADGECYVVFNAEDVKILNKTKLK